mmetsp:Transcript_1425/g.3819  ORF Transcript_1425/g.3819 Transcript_1425/m.3819 type:complete len:83 (-) Transcript_1425:17-265(-)
MIWRRRWVRSEAFFVRTPPSHTKNVTRIVDAVARISFAVAGWGGFFRDPAVNFFSLLFWSVALSMAHFPGRLLDGAAWHPTG